MGTEIWESISNLGDRYRLFWNPSPITGTASRTIITSVSVEGSVVVRKDNTIYCACWVHEKKLMPIDGYGNCRRCGCRHTANMDGLGRLYGRAPMGAIEAAGLKPSPAYSIGMSEDGEKSAVIFVTPDPVTLEEQFPVANQVDPDDDWEDEEDEDDEDMEDEDDE